jgi:hypothetical protein
VSECAQGADDILFFHSSRIVEILQGCKPRVALRPAAKGAS